MHIEPRAPILAALLLLGVSGIAGETWASRVRQIGAISPAEATGLLDALDELGAPAPIADADLELLVARLEASPRRVLVVSPIPLDPRLLPASRTYRPLAGGSTRTTVQLLDLMRLGGCGEALVVEETSRTVEEPGRVTSTFSSPFPGLNVAMRVRLIDRAGATRGERPWTSKAVGRTRADAESAVRAAQQADARREAALLLEDKPVAPLRVDFRVETRDGAVETLDWVRKAGGSVEAPKGSAAGSFVAHLPGGLTPFLVAAAETGRYSLVSFEPVTLQRK